MTKYQICIPLEVHGEQDYLSAQSVCSSILRDSGIPHFNIKWVMAQSRDLHYRIECNDETLSVLVLKGCRIVKNLTEEHIQKLAEAKLTGLAKLTEIEKEALGLT